MPKTTSDMIRAIQAQQAENLEQIFEADLTITDIAVENGCPIPFGWVYDPARCCWVAPDAVRNALRDIR